MSFKYGTRIADLAKIWTKNGQYFYKQTIKNKNFAVLEEIQKQQKKWLDERAAQNETQNKLQKDWGVSEFNSLYTLSISP